MKATNANQRVAREIAEYTARPQGVDWRKVRAENQARQDRMFAKRTTRTNDTDYTWLMHDICSTPYATVRT